MRILQILHNYKAGGAEQHLIQLSEGLRKAGHVVEIAAAEKSWVAEQLSQRRFVIHDFDFRSHCDPVSLFRLIGLLSKTKYDIVHTHLVRASFYGRLATRFTRTPMVSTVHDLTTWKHYPRKRNVIAVSAAVKKHLTDHYFDDALVHVIFPGARDCSATCSVRMSARNELGLNSFESAVFVVGRIAEVKGHDVALEAIQIARKKFGAPIRLFFVGQETAWGSKLRETDGVEDATWLGRRDDILELLSAADICIQPSRSEGLGLSLMEAASASKAMIGTNVGGIPEIIEHQHSGMLVPVENADALADAILFLLNNPGLAYKFGSVSRKNFEEKFSLEKMVTGTVDLYKKCLEVRPDLEIRKPVLPRSSINLRSGVVADIDADTLPMRLPNALNDTVEEVATALDVR